MTTTQSNILQPYPEGGTRAWLVVLGAWCAMIPSMGLLNTLAVLHAWITENELPDAKASSIAWIFSTYGFFLYFCGAQTGPIFDTYPVQYLIVPGSIGMTASVMLMSVSKELYQYILSFGVLGGISASMLFNPSIAAIGHWFSVRRGIATGIACSAGGLGGVIFPLIIVYCAPHIGFGWAMRIVGFICFVLGAIATILLQKRLPHNVEAGAAIDLKALREPRFFSTTIAIFLVEFAVFIPYTYICSYGLHVGLDSTSAYLLNVYLNAGAIPGRVLPGYLADRFGVFNTMIATSLTCGILVLALWLKAGAHSDATIAFSVLYGFWSGAAISLTPVCIGAVCETEDYGKRNGTTFFVASFGVLVGVPIGGAILQATATHDYTWLIVYGGLLYMASSISFIVARGLLVKKA